MDSYFTEEEQLVIGEKIYEGEMTIEELAEENDISEDLIRICYMKYVESI